MRTYNLNLTGNQIALLQDIFVDICDDNGGYSNLDPIMQDLIDKVYNTKPI